MKLSDEQFGFMLDVALLINFCASNGIKVTGGELYRTKEQQKIYFDTGLSKTMDSYHLKRLAIDLNFFINDVLTYKKEDLQKVGNFWEALSSKNKAGMNFKTFPDVPHFQRNVV